jgi:hypothetical protein
VHQIPFDDVVAREVEGLRPAGLGTCRLAGNDDPLVEAFVRAMRQAAGPLIGPSDILCRARSISRSLGTIRVLLSPIAGE